MKLKNIIIKNIIKGSLFYNISWFSSPFPPKGQLKVQSRVNFKAIFQKIKLSL